MSILDPFPLHARTSQASAREKRKLILLRAKVLRELAALLEGIVNETPNNDRAMTEEANFFLEHS